MLLARSGLVLKKIGCTTFFDKMGRPFLATALQLVDSYVVGYKTEALDGYNAVQIGYSIVENEKKIKKPLRVALQKRSVPLARKIKEFRVENFDNSPSVGEKLTIDHFKPGEYIDAIGCSIGKGFAGVMKRHNFKCGPASHGNSLSHRVPGSTGQRQDPGKVFKGKKMPGRMGGYRVTVMNLMICEVNKELSTVFIAGGIVGHKNSYVCVRDSIKRRVF